MPVIPALRKKAKAGESQVQYRSCLDFENWAQARVNWEEESIEKMSPSSLPVGKTLGHFLA